MAGEVEVTGTGLTANAIMKVTRNRVAADVVLATHCLFSSFAVFGGALIAVDKRWLWLHGPAVLWIFTMNVAGWTCPLTVWEKKFRQHLGKSYDGGFIQQYIGPVIRGEEARRHLEVIVAASVLSWNVLVYIVMFRYFRR